MQEKDKGQRPRLRTHSDLIADLQQNFKSATVKASTLEDHQSEKTSKEDSSIEVTFLRRSPKS